jgi:hypothetical protein
VRRAFRIVAAVFGVLVIALSLPFTVASFTDDAESIHRFHNVAGLFGFALLLGVSLLACARRPEWIGPFWVAVASGVASTMAGVVSGDFVSGVWFTAPIALLVLVALHPYRRALLDARGIDVPAAVLGLLAVVPAVAFALTQAQLQRDGLAADPHVEFHHYSGMASYAMAIPLAAFAASLVVPGRRVSAWIVGLTAVGLGVSSIVLSDHVGAFEAPWSWLLLVWGVVFIGVAQSRGRTEEAGA